MRCLFKWTIRCQRFVCGCSSYYWQKGCGENFRIKINGNKAKSKCSAQVGHVGKSPNKNETYEMWGVYQDKWKKKTDGWKIIERRLIVLNEFGNRDKVLGP